MMDNRPMVSIVMPTYNAERYIEEAIQSVVNQTFTDWELLVVDDCSTDRTGDIVLKFSDSDKRIRYFKQHINGGAARSRNRAIQEAGGEYLAFLDCDDIWMPEKLERQLAFMKEGNFDFSCTAYAFIDEQGNRTGKAVLPFRKAGYRLCLYYGNCVGNSTAMLRIGKTGKVYSPEIRKRNDFALWLRALRRTSYVYGIQEVLGEYRVRKNSLSAKKMGLFRYQWDLYRNVEKLPVIQCLMALCVLVARKLIGFHVVNVEAIENKSVRKTSAGI